MEKTVLLDTNLLLDDANIIYKMSKEYDTLILSRTVLKELDKHKYNKDLSYSARNAINALLQFDSDFPGRLKFHFEEEEIDTNDEFILNAAAKNNAVVATKDISMSFTAKAKGLRATLFDIVLNNIFDPYIYLVGNDLYKEENLFSYQTSYCGSDYKNLFNIFQSKIEKILSPNAWFFIFIQAERENPYIYAHNPLQKRFDRIDNISRYLEVKINGRTIKAMDIYQNCALYALEQAPNCLITGRWGSGKTLLTTSHSINNCPKKVFITRPPIGINAKYDLGFFPGPKEEKMMDWLSGFTSALYYIYGNTNGQVDSNRTGYNYVIDNIFPTKFEVLSLNQIQGLSLLNNDVLLVDEIQLISVDYMSMLLSRPTSSGKLILMGDLKQTYNIVKPSESGLLKLLRLLPHKSLAFVDLQNSYRSDLVELADKLQDKTLG